MGYTTVFEGRFNLDKLLTQEHYDYLLKFSDTRRMKRDPKIAETLMDVVRDKVGLPIGEDGEYFVGSEEPFGQGRDASIINFNGPPAKQPGLWCKWEPTKDLKGIAWNSAEKFYDYPEWLQYLCDHFLTRWGYTLSGSVRWQGEDDADIGVLLCLGNKVLACEFQEFERLSNNPRYKKLFDTTTSDPSTALVLMDLLLEDGELDG